MSAPDCAMTFCGSTVLPIDFDILRPFSSSVKPWVSTISNGARPRVPQLSSSDDWNQPRCWSEPSRYITVSSPPSTWRRMSPIPGKCTRSSSTKAWVEPESNQTSQMSSIFLHASSASEPRKRSRAPSLYQAGGPRAGVDPAVAHVASLPPRFTGERAEKAFAGAVHVPGVGAFLLEGISDARVDGVVLQDFGGAVAVFPHEHRDRHAPGALARDHPVGLAIDHAVDAVLARRRHPLRHRDGFKCPVPKSIQRINSGTFPSDGTRCDRLIHRDEPLRRVSEDHRLL